MIKIWSLKTVRKGGCLRSMKWPLQHFVKENEKLVIDMHHHIISKKQLKSRSIGLLINSEHIWFDSLSHDPQSLKFTLCCLSVISEPVLRREYVCVEWGNKNTTNVSGSKGKGMCRLGLNEGLKMHRKMQVIPYILYTWWLKKLIIIMGAPSWYNCEESPHVHDLSTHSCDLTQVIKKMNIFYHLE